MLSDNNLLIRALRSNAVFSGLSALLMLVTAEWLAAQLSLRSAVPVYVTAALLILFALQLANIVRTREIKRWEIKAIISGDLAWVVASIVLVALFHQSITAAGLMLIDIVAIAVLFFAIQQIRGLRALGAAA